MRRDDLAVFLAAAKTGSIRRAAERLPIVLSDVTTRIRIDRLREESEHGLDDVERPHVA